MALLCPSRASCVHKQQQVVCSASTTWAQPKGSVRPRSRHTCSASASGDGTAGKLPVVDDAISLPPPATGSQYQWRRNWGGSSASSGSGGSGGSGRSWQARTRDWGRGPNSSILFVILYRMRLLLLYGVWVTVLYGAFRAVVDLTTAAGKAGYSLVNKAADMLYGTSSSSTSSSDGSSGSSAAGSDVEAATALGCADDACEAASVQAQTSGETPSEASTANASTNSSFPAANRLKDRPTATVYENMMSAVIPVYLMLLGSVVFFASI